MMSYNFRINAYRTSHRTLFTKKELARETKGGDNAQIRITKMYHNYVFESVFSALLLPLMCLH